MSIRFDPDELRELEKRLTERLESIAPAPRRAAGERVRAKIAATPQRRGLGAWLAAHQLTPAWPRYAAVAAVVVAALAVGVGIGSSGLLNAPHSPAASPSPSAFGDTWQPLDVVPPATHATDLVEDGYAGPTRTVLVGERGGPKEAGGDTTAAAWYTDDGITWHASEINGIHPNLDVHGLNVVFAFSDNLYAIGPADPQSGQGTATSGSVIVEFESTDGGATWTQLADVNPPAAFDGVIAAGPGLVAVNAASALVWSSTDGRTWIAHPTPNTARVAGESLYAVASHGEALMAVGQAWQTPSGDGISGIVITSSDGLHWTRRTPPGDFAPLDVTWADGAWLMAGYSGTAAGATPHAAILRSTDGLTWSPVDLASAPPGPDIGSAMVSVAAGADGVVAIGGGGSSTGPSFSAWTSSDGSSWQLHTLPDGSVGSAQAVTALVRPGQIVVAGNGWTTSRDRLPAVWVSPAAASPPGPTASASVQASIGPAPATASPTPASSVSMPSVFASWTRLDLPDPAPNASGGTGTTSVVRFGDRWIAVGNVNDGSRAVIWTSTDGRSWQLVAPQASLAHAHIDSVASDGSHLVAVGTDYSAPASWYSTDGVTWHAAGNPPPLSLVTAAGGRFVAISDGGQSVTFYASVDGRTWSSVGTQRSADPTQTTYVYGLAGRGDGPAVAVGSVTVPAQADAWSQPMSWFTPATGGGVTPGGTHDPAVMVAVTAGPNGWVAVGGTNAGSPPLAWRSFDGVDWGTPQAMAAAGPYQLTAVRVVAAGPDLVAAGMFDAGGAPNAVAWVESGGSWEQVAASAFSGTDNAIFGLAWDESGQRVLAVGTRQVGMRSVPVLWIANR